MDDPNATRQPPSHEEKGPAPSISRREFLRLAGIAAAGSLLAACGVDQQTGLTTPAAPSPAPRTILPSPQAAGELPVTGQDLSPELGRFLALSTLLTGFENLDPVLGQVYMDSFGADVPLEDLYNAAGFQGETAPQSLAELESRGFFNNQGLNEAAGKIMNAWYSGTYTGPDGSPVVATFVDALVWRAIRFTKPQTICGYPFFWEEAPAGEH